MDDPEDTALFNWRDILKGQNIIRIVLFLAALIGCRIFGALFASLLGIVLILWNLGERNGGASAYSIFNRGFAHLLGDLRPEDIERELRHNDGNNDSNNQPILEFQGVIEYKSRDANKKCKCGSGKKTKVCCGVNI